jgi:hypothetical protein
MLLPVRRLIVPLLAGLALSAGGCGSEEAITSYKVPKATEREAKPEAADYRLLGAMFPADDPVWFFKFSGTAEQVAKYEQDFDRLLGSVKLRTDGKLPEFTLPNGWKRGGPRGEFVAETIKLPEPALEISITQSQGGVAGNLNRWVGQIGLKSGPDDREKFTRNIDAAGGKGVRVDLKGPKDPATMRGPMMGKGR